MWPSSVLPNGPPPAANVGDPLLTCNDDVLSILAALQPFQGGQGDLGLLLPEQVDLRSEKADLLGQDRNVLRDLGPGNLDVGWDLLIGDSF